MNHHELLEQIIDNIKQYYPCKFLSSERRTGSYFYVTENTKKKLTLGFGGSYRLVLSRNTPKQYKKLFAGEPVIITSEGIRFIKREDIITRPSVASLFVEEDKTIDVYCSDYSGSKGSECYFNLCIEYPNVSENILRTAEYFCLNPVPKGVYLEIDSSVLEYILMCTDLIKDKIQCKS